MGIRILISIRDEENFVIKLVTAQTIEYKPRKGKAYVYASNGETYVVYSKNSEEEIKLFSQEIDRALERGYADLSNYESAYGGR